MISRMDRRGFLAILGLDVAGSLIAGAELWAASASSKRCEARLAALSSASEAAFFANGRKGNSLSPADAVPRVYLQMLTDYRRYAETLWHQPQPGFGYWGSGRAQGGNEGMRAVANTALSYALLQHEGDQTFGVEDRVAPALRYVAASHLTGSSHGTDGKQWGNSWQSAMYAGTLGIATWLVRDNLDTPTKTAVERVVGYEASRFIGANPPSMEPGDTKAEENAWNLTAPAAALLLMPHSVRAAGWREALTRYAFNTLSVPPDRTSNRVIDGKPLREWVSTTQLYPDFTLENHGFFHPTYMMVAPGLEGTAAMDLKLAGELVPDALRHNVLQEWKTLPYITLADGGWLYPQGQDWDLHSYEQILYWAMMATMYRDPTAALLEQRTAGYARHRQLLNGDGRFVGSMSPLGFAREAAQVERVAAPYLMHQAFGSTPPGTDADWDRMLKTLQPVRAFYHVGFVVHRLPRGLFSFSWKNHLMGLAVPQCRTHLDSPYVTTPMLGALVGTVTAEGQAPGHRGVAGHFTVLRVTVHTSTDGFAVALEADVNDGLLRQQIAVTSSAPGVLAYLDRVAVQKNVRIVETRGLLVGIENDYLNGNQRRISSAGGEWIATGGDEGDHPIPRQWANVDGRLGLVCALGSGLLYRSVGKPNRPGARQDLLIGSCSRRARRFEPRALVTERAGLLILDSSAAETAATAARTHVQRTEETMTLTFTSPDGRAHSLRLTADGTAHWDGLTLLPT